MLAYVGLQVLRLASNLVLTRLLAPELFGLMAVTISLVIIVTLLSDVGIRQAVVQSRRGESPAMLSTAFTMQFARSWAIWLVCVAVAFVIDAMARRGAFAPGTVYASPELLLLTVLVTASAVTTGLESTKLMLADRWLNLKRASIIEVVSMVVTAVVMVTLASVWKSIWPLVIGVHTSALVTTLLSHLWLHGPRDRFGWDADCAREIARFGRWILLASGLFVLSTNADRLLLGAWVSQAQLGFYVIALTLSQVVEAAMNKLMQSVAMPAFSEVVRRNPDDLPRAHWRVRLPLDAVTLVASGLLFALGGVVIDLLYDPRYRDAGHILEILGCSLVLLRYNISFSAYVAMGRTEYTTIVNGVRLIGLLVAMPLGWYTGGLEGVYWGIALHTVAKLPVYYVLNRRHGLWHWGRELTLLPLWPCAWLFGWAVAAQVRPWLGA
jgi:O-antigen/teichoic acid export membrane protein